MFNHIIIRNKIKELKKYYMNNYKEEYLKKLGKFIK
jgi:hypothetical protein